MGLKDCKFFKFHFATLIACHLIVTLRAVGWKMLV